MNLEDLQKRVDENADRILNNLEKINTNEQKILNNETKIQKNSMALEILKDYKKQNKRLFVILIFELIIWIITLIVFHVR
jgi:hypothetical protein